MTLLIGKRYEPELAQSLGAHGIEVIWLPDNRDIDPRLAGHADLSVFVGQGHVVAAKGVYPVIVNLLTNRGYTVIEAERKQGPVYPNDVGLCVCATGKYTLYDPKTVDPAVAPLLGGKLVSVNQGYTRCAAAVVDDHSIITADAGVSRAAKNAGMDVLDIEPGYIELKGYGHGFIGGASFKISDNTVAFTGKLTEHPDGGHIYEFLAKHGQKALILTDRPIFDVGGAIALP